ncbi:ABC transporter ATP-binding protein [Nitrospirillum sp. BR 11752]|uniref:Branched-chain amino acid transport system ATP-binding protein n=1 Tax=Nitrospirillum amazonense TaxID=28077 RepID=A0A560HFE9_9PROT|nr:MULTISPECIES: ABC transporter ATP-binding protein [Nitrospirillum]MDZ5647505.1 ABC transporter ATP-binding protein [Nitrospirillum sp. BR 11828]MEE3626926.1 ABC transporter ATP-binding protein [Nitrospirillum sp. BR 11752]TWB45142.1 branched-chain amino acid transport system ATP-binding protein [Nitrospirillum amazonense]
MAGPLLQLSDVHASYGPVHALRGVNVTVNEGEIVTLIGANGAGKSTLLMTLCGNPRPSQGQILFQDKSLVGLPPHLIAAQGIAQVPEGRRIFPRMTVLENLRLGATLADPAHFAEDLATCYGLFPILEKRQAQRAGTLSGGEQQMLAISRALMSRPRVLLLDEPSLGLAPLIIRQIFQVIEQLNRERGMTILLVEQNAYHALKLAHRAYVLASGEVVLTGSGRELLANEQVRAAYLEGGAH